jgi:hypothetical protein
MKLQRAKAELKALEKATKVKVRRRPTADPSPA